MDLETILFNTPHILETVFQNLACLDLCRCACVNKLWNHISITELDRRKKTVFFYQDLKCSYHKRDHSTIRGCSMKNAGRFEDDFNLQIRNLEIKPAFCIAFANCTFWDNFELLFPSHPVSKPKRKKFKKMFDDNSRQKYFESVVQTVLKKRLPRNCQVCLYIGKDTIYTQSDSDKVLDGVQVPAISGYFFSELPQQGIQFCRRKISDKKVFKTLTTQNDKKSAFVLMEHKTIGYFAFGLRVIQKKFNVFEKGIVFPVQIGSDCIPLFYGPNVETACFTMPFSNNQDSRIVKFLERTGTIAFVFGKYHQTVLKASKDFGEKYPNIPIAGLCEYSEGDFESTNDVDFYSHLIRTEINLNFNCKCILISIKY